MDEVILSASGSPWGYMAASESMDEVIHSASGPHAKKLEYLSFKIGTPVFFAALFLIISSGLIHVFSSVFNLHTDFTIFVKMSQHVLAASRNLSTWPS
jgi:hypothetical protein